MKLKDHEKLWTNLYSRTFKRRFQGWVDRNKRSRKELSLLLRKLGVTNILDVGCGLVLDYEQYMRDDLQAKYSGIDLTEPFIQEARKKHPLLDLKIASVEQIPYPDNSFDIVTCRHLLEHLSCPEKAISEMSRVARKYVIIVWFIPPGENETQTKLVKDLPKWKSIFYENHYSEKYILNLAKVNHLSLLEKIGCGPSYGKQKYRDEIWVLKGATK